MYPQTTSCATDPNCRLHGIFKIMGWSWYKCWVVINTESQYASFNNKAEDWAQVLLYMQQQLSLCIDPVLIQFLGSDQLIKYHLYTKMSVYMQVFCIDSFPNGRRCFFCSLRMYFFVHLNSGWTSRWLWLYLEAVEWLVGFFVVLSSSTCCEGLVCFLSTLQPKPLYNLMKNHFRNLSCLIMKANGIIMVIFACRYCSIVISC